MGGEAQAVNAGLSPHPAPNRAGSSGLMGRMEGACHSKGLGWGLSGKSLPAPRSSRRRQLGITHTCLASLTPPLGVPTPEPRHTEELMF